MFTHLGLHCSFYAVPNLVGNATKQQPHLLVISIVVGDDPYHAKRPHQGGQTICHGRKGPAPQHLKVPLKRRQELEIVSGFLSALQNTTAPLTLLFGLMHLRIWQYIVWEIDGNELIV